MVLAASTVAIVAIAVVIVVAIVALMYILPRGGRRRRQVRPGPRADEERWRAYHTDDEPPEVISPEVICAEREFKQRRLPLFLLPDVGRCRLQPVSVFDVARVAADLGESDGNVVLDLAGPETLPFADFVARIRDAVGSDARLVAAPSGVVSTCSRLAGFLPRDRLLTRDELGALTANLLACERATTESRLSDWLKANASWLGRDYANELRHNWNPSLVNS